MMKTINFDMDGTLANFYGVEGWLEYLIALDPTPYAVAKPLINLSVFARYIHKLQARGYEINIISWLSKTSTEAFDVEVTEVKIKWLKTHLPSVNFDNIHILPYGTPKENYGTGILFDDEQKNRDNWNGIAYDVDNINGILRNLLSEQISRFQF